MINSGDEGSMVLTIRGAGSELRYSRNEGEEGGVRYLLNHRYRQFRLQVNFTPQSGVHVHGTYQNT
jgi:hypothetical protein